MDYKYIEQLLDRYWACETTPQEEEILRAFFVQDDVPAALARYRDLFVYEHRQGVARVPSADFDSRLCRLAGVGDEPRQVHARRVSFAARLRPLYRAAAVVAVVVTLGTGAQHVFNRQQEPAGWDYNVDAYKDSYDNPREAYENLDNSIRELKEVLGTTPSDTGRVDTIAASRHHKPAL